jgi:class 3 adenylate cyclase
VIKFIGDCVMASFTPQQADAAISASLNILTALEQKREQAATNDPLRLLHTGIDCLLVKSLKATLVQW